MAEWEKQIFAVNLIVGNLERSKAFYREVFGLAPLDEEEDLAIFRFKDTYVALRHDPAHEDAPSGEVLEEHGVTVISGPADRDWGMRTISFADPGGYTWGIAQDLPSAPSP